jgi:hypothetical protein
MAALIIPVEKCQPKIEVLDTSDYTTPIGFILRMAFSAHRIWRKSNDAKGFAKIDRNSLLTRAVASDYGGLQGAVTA